MPYSRARYKNEDIEGLDNVIFLCLNPLKKNDLPQVAEEEDLIAAALHDLTGKPYDLIASEMHHQVDGSYQ